MGTSLTLIYIPIDSFWMANITLQLIYLPA